MALDAGTVATPAPSSSDLPSGATLLALEQQVRHGSRAQGSTARAGTAKGGTGLTARDLAGCWQLDQVWPKGSARPASFSGLLLRGLAARLEIEASAEALQLSNVVNLGVLELRFRGPGTLVGSRPLLQFWFEQLELRLAGRLLLQRSLPAPPSRRLPFFALIARDPAGWLAARGRGGGLALWRLQPVGPSGAAADRSAGG